MNAAVGWRGMSLLTISPKPRRTSIGCLRRRGAVTSPRRRYSPRFAARATRVLREMLLNRLEEVKRIGSLERRTDALENDEKHIKGGMNYLFKQVTSPDEPPRRRIGFGADENDHPTKPYAKI